MFHRKLVIACSMIVAAGATALGQGPVDSPRPADAVPRPPGDPESTLKSFLVALWCGDEAALRTTTDPVEGVEWLLTGSRSYTPAQVPEIRKSVDETMSLKRLGRGQSYKLHDGTIEKVRDEQVTADRVLLLVGESPTPLSLRRLDGEWRVDARSIIAARRVAEEARRKADGPERPSR